MTIELHISDHAILRWLERVEGVDVAAIRKRIHTEAVRAVEFKAPRIKKDGVEYSITYEDDHNAVVVTTYSTKVRTHLSVKRLSNRD